jgi:hypothetical protein
LHFHGFDDEKALACFDRISHLNEDANDFAGHGSEDLLAALGLDGTMPPAPPRARINNLSDKFLQAGLDLKRSVR